MARYIMVEYNYVDVVGLIWMPQTTCSYRYNLDSYAIENIREHGEGEITREAIEQWLTTNSGDFSSIQDFRASIGDLDIPFATEEGELAYYDTVAEE